MNDTTKIGIAGVLLLVSAALLFYSGLQPNGTAAMLAIAGLATSGLAAGSLLMGGTGSDGRMV